MKYSWCYKISLLGGICFDNPQKCTFVSIGLCCESHTTWASYSEVSLPSTGQQIQLTEQSSISKTVPKNGSWRLASTHTASHTHSFACTWTQCEDILHFPGHQTWCSHDYKIVLHHASPFLFKLLLAVARSLEFNISSHMHLNTPLHHWELSVSIDPTQM